MRAVIGRLAAPPANGRESRRLRRSITLRRRFGAYYLLLVALLSCVCIAVVINLGRMRRDAARLLEETREHALAAEIQGKIQVLDATLGKADAPWERPPADIERARALIQDVKHALVRLDGRAEDPSRVEHQAREDRLSAQVVTDFDRLSVLLSRTVSTDAGSANDEADAILKHAQAFAASLDEETRREAQRADADLTAHGTSTRRVMIATVVAVSMALCAGFVHVLRTVLAPLRVVRAGADRFGAGRLDHRISVRNRDEIGDLARSFNEMAGRIADTQSELEARVASRTKEFIRAARLADLGVLAAGVAHEINNPLASIASCAEGLERRLARSEVDAVEQRDYLRTISSEAYRAREITTRLLSLARQEPSETADVDLGLVLRQVETAVVRLLEPRKIRLRSEFPPGVSVRANAGELIQILVNLILNAKDASRDGTTIDLRCRSEPDWVVFEVQDQGHGIAAQDLDRIFDPFFTTKRPGEGTGLGLSLVAALVEARGGSVGVESRPGEGSVFSVRLPRCWRESA